MVATPISYATQLVPTACTAAGTAPTPQPLTPSQTYLTAAITTTSVTTCSVPLIAAGTFNPAMQPGFPWAGTFDIQIGTEDLTVTAGWGTTTWTITRGANSTTPATHLINAPITFFGQSGFTATPAATTLTDGLVVKALPTNVGIVGVGISSSSSTFDLNRCHWLAPGEAVVLSSSEVANTNTGIFLVGTTAGDSVSYIGA